MKSLIEEIRRLKAEAWEINQDLTTTLLEKRGFIVEMASVDTTEEITQVIDITE